MNKPNPPDGILPWTRSCFVCGEANSLGLRLKSRLEKGRVVLDYTARQADLGYSRIVHGGIVMTLLDEVMTWAAIIGAGRMCVMAEMNSRLLNPVEVGQALRFEGWVTRASSRLLLTEGQVTAAASGNKMAGSSGKYLPMPEETIKLCAEDFVASPEALQIEKLLKTDSQPPA